MAAVTPGAVREETSSLYLVDPALTLIFTQRGFRAKVSRGKKRLEEGQAVD